MKKETVIKWVKRVFKSAVAAIRKHEGPITIAGLAGLFIYYLLSGDADGGATMAIILAGTSGGVSVSEEPATLANVGEATESLVRPAIDSRVVKIRPSSTPLDQISRWGGSRLIGSMKAEYYSVDTKPIATVTTSQLTSGKGAKVLEVENGQIFSPSDTLLLPDVEITTFEGEKQKGLVVYVAEVDGNEVTVVVTNNYLSGEVSVPEVASGTKVIRMGRAAAELDVQTSQYEALPLKKYNYCQIFKSQIEQSALLKLANKEVRWSLADMEESAIVDMRMAMEKSFLFGHRSHIENPTTGEQIYLTGGIWDQAGKTFEYDTFNTSKLVDLCREAFTGNGGSPRKVLIGGSNLIAALNKLESTRVVVGQESAVCWGVDFTRINTHFGSLYVALSETFDHCNQSWNGMVIDPEYIVKYSHVPFTAERLDLRRSGQRNTEAIVLTEASCLVLRYPDAHMRIVHNED